VAAEVLAVKKEGPGSVIISYHIKAMKIAEGYSFRWKEV
jgi:hypothetical protein